MFEKKRRGLIEGTAIVTPCESGIPLRYWEDDVKFQVVIKALEIFGDKCRIKIIKSSGLSKRQSKKVLPEWVSLKEIVWIEEG